MLDPVTGRIRVRRVDLMSARYRIARRSMIRLQREDFDDPHQLARIAATAGVSLEEFQRQFAYLIESEPPPLRLLGEGISLPPGEAPVAAEPAPRRPVTAGGVPR
jgi:hypothetical protein